jgi:hypothetical protein
MRRFQRVAVVAAAVAGLSAFGIGASSASAHDDWDGQAVTAVANSTANATATWGAPHDKDKGAEAPYAAPQAAPVAAPEAAPKAAAPEYGYGEYSAPAAAPAPYAAQ